jgi:Flp pilus assembly protein TadG
MIEFAFVILLLVALIYGIVSVGLSLAAKATVTQAAEDGARAGIVDSTALAAKAAAIAQASGDLSWMGKGACNAGVITCVATEAPCTSNTANTCLTVNVSYNYAAHPLFPIMPGLGILAPATISSSATLQVSTPTS